MNVLKIALGVALGLLLAAGALFATCAAVQNYGHRKNVAAERAAATSQLRVKSLAIWGGKLHGVVSNDSKFTLYDVRAVVEIRDIAGATETASIEVPLAVSRANTPFEQSVTTRHAAGFRTASITCRQP